MQEATVEDLEWATAMAFGTPTRFELPAALNNTFYHWGSIIVPTGYTDSSVYAAGGNPYGASWATADGPTPDSNALAVAHYQGKRLASIAGRLAR